MLNTASSKGYPPIFGLGFRPFFLFGSFVGFLSVALWLVSLQGVVFEPFGGALWWHGHEMIFGFVMAIIVGFLLTAVQNWTGIPSINGWLLFVLFACWAGARVGLAMPNIIPVVFSMTLDILFLPLAAFFFALPIVKVKLWRNLFFVPILLIFACANSISYFSIMHNDWSGVIGSHYFSLALILLVITIMGGRVIPMFTANATHSKKVIPIKWLERFLIGFHLLLAVSYLLGGYLPNYLLSYAMAVLWGCIALGHILRWSRWQASALYQNPLLWSLHIGYLFLPLGAVAVFLHYAFGIAALSTMIHMVTIGTIGGIILAMIVRVSYGHTGRALSVGPIMATAFVLLFTAAIVRSIVLALLPGYAQLTLMVSGILWCLAFTLFILVFYPILNSPRIDGKPG